MAFSTCLCNDSYILTPLTPIAFSYTSFGNKQRFLYEICGLSVYLDNALILPYPPYSTPNFVQKYNVCCNPTSSRYTWQSSTNGEPSSTVVSPNSKSTPSIFKWDAHKGNFQYSFNPSSSNTLNTSSKIMLDISILSSNVFNQYGMTSPALVTKPLQPIWILFSIKNLKLCPVTFDTVTPFNSMGVICKTGVNL